MPLNILNMVDCTLSSGGTWLHLLQFISARVNTALLTQQLNLAA